MENYEDPISGARAKLEEARINLFDAYILKIREKYLSYDSNKKEAFVKGLESFTSFIENNSFSNEAFSFLRKYNNTSFDSTKARETRTHKGIKQYKLAEDLGLPASVISSYESGRLIPQNPPTTFASRQYISWLKEHGYNPYNL